jgi:lysyl-tRNA synthetase class 2
MDLFGFIPGYTEHIYEPGKEPLLFMFLAFLIAFSITRSYTRVARRRGWGSGSVGGVHLHHVVPGIIMVLVTGVLLAAPIGMESPTREVVCIVFGVGAALVLDEFALVFHLKDVYWSTEGRSSVDAVILGTALCGLLLISSSPWGVDEDVTQGYLPKSILFALFATHLVFAIVCYLKGKYTIGTIGLFIPLVGAFGAVRLAKPDSPWARRRYGEARLARSRARFDAGRAARYEDRVLDLIGGKPNSPNGTSGA